jgi:5'(3')-deoxyribonucleotidase
MKLRVSELDRPINNELMHYTNFDPKERGYIRQGGMQYDKMFSLRDLTVSDSIRNLREENLHRNTSTTSDNGYYDMLNITLSKPYTDKNGVTYNNYGRYILRTLYDHPEFFKNSYSFVNHVFPGIHAETIDGTGVMARIMEMNLFVFFKNKSEDEEFDDFVLMTSTEEVVQTTKVTNDKEAINRLVADNSCTYLKTPAGIFTEVTFPVDEICTTHPKDSLLSAQIAFQRQNNLS